MSGTNFTLNKAGLATFFEAAHSLELATPHVKTAEERLKLLA